jgi:uncharacterized SAM-binding protein YcdF (DUF218 family)
MLFILSKLSDVITAPSDVLLLASVAGVVLTLRRPSSRWPRRLLVAGVGGLLAFAVLPLGSWMIRPLETRFPMPDPMPAHVDGIIVLGGAISVDRSIAWRRPVLNDAAERMTTFIAMAHRYRNARLLFTGGNADPFHPKASEAQIAGHMFDELGMKDRNIIYEARSRNTHENALYSRRLVNPRPGETWLLVTTAADLPRAVGCFRAVDWPVIAIPSNYRSFRRGSDLLPGLVEGFRSADWAMHEWIGLLYYRLRGWTPTLFPGPG